MNVTSQEGKNLMYICKKGWKTNERKLHFPMCNMVNCKTFFKFYLSLDNRISEMHMMEKIYSIVYVQMYCTYLLPSNTSTVYLTSAKGSLFAKSLISDCVNITSRCCIRSQKFEISKQKQKKIRVGTENNNITI